jgi:hypothetical protein
MENPHNLTQEQIEGVNKSFKIYQYGNTNRCLKSKALRSLFQHLVQAGFDFVSIEPQCLDIGEEDEVFGHTAFQQHQLFKWGKHFDYTNQKGEEYRYSDQSIYEYYEAYDDDYILTVVKDGKQARILQTWYGGVEGLYSNASAHKDIYDDLEEASDKWYDEMERKDIQW